MVFALIQDAERGFRSVPSTCAVRNVFIRLIIIRAKICGGITQGNFGLVQAESNLFVLDLATLVFAALIIRRVNFVDGEMNKICVFLKSNTINPISRYRLRNVYRSKHIFV